MAAWESAPLVTGDAPAWQSAPLVGDHPAPAVLPAVDDYGRPTPDMQLPAEGASMPTVASMREALKPEPGWVQSGILPIATKEVSPGQGDPSAGIKLDWGPIRTIANPLLDLLEGTGFADSVGGPNAPLAGKVSPEATALLGSFMIGNLNPLAPRSEIMRPPFAGPLAPQPRPEAAAADRPTSLAPAVEPGPAGADITTAPIPAKTRGQERTDLRKSVTQTAVERAGPQGIDEEVYVPGVERPLAARAFSPENAANEKVLRATDKDFDTEMRGIEKHNNDVMVDHYLEHAGDANAIEAAETARDAVTPPSLHVFDDEKPVDAQPVVDKIDTILGGATGKRTAAVSVLKDVRDKLFNADGELETMPSVLYGARQNITDKLAKMKGIGDEATSLKLVRRELMDVLETLDPTIGAGAPGFEPYLKAYSAASVPINQMEFLQSHLSGPGKITDVRGNLQLNRVQKLLEKIDRLRSASGTNAAKSLSDEQIQAIINIRNELAALAHRDFLASTKGSDTVQNASTAGKLGSGPLGKAVRTAADLATQGALYATTGPMGNVVYQYGFKPVVAARREAKEQARLSGIKRELLQTRRNPLAPD